MVLKISGKAILLVVAGGGMIVTACLAAKNAPDAEKKKEAALQEKREKTGDPNAKLTFAESVKSQIGSYTPAIVSGMVALGGLVGSDVINEKNLKRVEKSYNDYKSMTDKLEGKNTSKVIERAVEQKRIDEKNKKPWNVKEQFRIVFQGKSIMFESTRTDVVEAIYELNRTFSLRGVVSFNDFLKYLDVEPVEEGDARGWEQYIGESIYGYTWIDIGLKDSEDEPWVTELFMPVYPHFFDEESCEYEINEGIHKLISDGGKGANDGEE